VVFNLWYIFNFQCEWLSAICYIQGADIVVVFVSQVEVLK